MEMTFLNLLNGVQLFFLINNIFFKLRFSFLCNYFQCDGYLYLVFGATWIPSLNQSITDILSCFEKVHLLFFSVLFSLSIIHTFLAIDSRILLSWRLITLFDHLLSPSTLNLLPFFCILVFLFGTFSHPLVLPTLYYIFYYYWKDIPNFTILLIFYPLFYFAFFSRYSIIAPVIIFSFALSLFSIFADLVPYI